MIGAGAAGLSALRHFTSKPDCFNVTAFELHDRIGGTWTYTDQVGFNQYGIRIHSSMYKNLRFVRDPCFVLLGKIFKIAFFSEQTFQWKQWSFRIFPPTVRSLMWIMRKCWNI